MKYLKIFESVGNYGFLYTYDDIHILINKKWSNININRDTIAFTVDGREYGVIFEKGGDINDIYIQENVREEFCKKINMSILNSDLSKIKNIRCLNNYEKLKKSKRFNL